MKNRQNILGYFLVITGVMIIGLNAYVFFFGSGFRHFPFGSLLLVILIGFILIKNYKK